ncbi:hypothetical protein V6N13_114860 [Hibiscus sabdariffa]|uniref:Uncharacterized protein n=1 Tax=Hibiscus sabdariffa TaxID=183260 RepID=A0ABR2U3C5_9ROSI
MRELKLNGFILQGKHSNSSSSGKGGFTAVREDTSEGGGGGVCPLPICIQVSDLIFMPPMKPTGGDSPQDDGNDVTLPSSPREIPVERGCVH